MLGTSDSAGVGVQQLTHSVRCPRSPVGHSHDGWHNHRKRRFTGWKNGPADRIFLPIGATIDRRVDQANVITAIGRPEMAAFVLSTLTETLPSYGWTITADAGGSLVFSDATYDGAFTSDSSLWALTIRVKA